jgi:transposase
VCLDFENNHVSYRQRAQANERRLPVVDWKKIKAEYIAGGTSYRQLAEKYGVSFSTLRKVAAKENWTDLRNKCGTKSDTKIIERLSDKSVDKMSRVLDITDKLLDKLEQAIEELDIQLYKSVVKTKEIEYNHDLRPDKPTKETIYEEEKVIEVKSIVDRSGLKAIASSLRDIKEIQMLKTELDKQEQEARIRNLEHQIKKDENTVGKVEVVFSAGEDAWNE